MAYKFQPTEPSGGSKGSGLDFGALPSANAGGIDFLSKANERSDRLKAQKVKAVGELRDYIFGKDSGLSSISEQVIGDDPKAKEYFMNHLNYYTTQLEDLVSTADQPDTEYRVAKLANEFNKSLLPGGGLYPYKQHSEALKEKQKERESAHYAKTLETDPMADDEAEGVLSGYKGAISFNADGKPVHSPLRVPRIGQAYDATKFGEWMSKLEDSDVNVEQNGPTASKIPLLSPDGKTYTESGLLSIDNPENYKGITWERARQHALASPEFNINLQREQRRLNNKYDNLTADQKESLLQKGLDKEKYLSLLTEEFLKKEVGQFVRIDKDNTKDTQVSDPNFMSADKQFDNNIAWNRLATAKASIALQKEKFKYQKEKDANKGTVTSWKGFEVPGMTAFSADSEGVNFLKDKDGNMDVNKIINKYHMPAVKSALLPDYEDWRRGQISTLEDKQKLKPLEASDLIKLRTLKSKDGNWDTKNNIYRDNWIKSIDSPKSLADYFSKSTAMRSYPMINLPIDKTNGPKAKAELNGIISMLSEPSNEKAFTTYGDAKIFNDFKNKNNPVTVTNISYGFDEHGNPTYNIKYYTKLNPTQKEVLIKPNNTYTKKNEIERVRKLSINVIGNAIDQNSSIDGGVIPNIEIGKSVKYEADVLSKFGGTQFEPYLKLLKNQNLTQGTSQKNIMDNPYIIESVDDDKTPVKHSFRLLPSGLMKHTIIKNGHDIPMGDLNYGEALKILSNIN